MTVCRCCQVAKFAVEVAQFKVAERLLLACIVVDEKIRGSTSTKLARDQVRAIHSFGLPTHFTIQS